MADGKVRSFMMIFSTGPRVEEQLSRRDDSINEFISSVKEVLDINVETVVVPTESTIWRFVTIYYIE